MKNKYRITEEAWYNEHGDKIVLGYHIQKFYSFLGIRYWKNLYRYNDYAGYKLKFETYREAQNYVEKNLLTNRPMDQYVTTVMQEYS